MTADRLFSTFHGMCAFWNFFNLQAGWRVTSNLFCYSRHPEIVNEKCQRLTVHAVFWEMPVLYFHRNTDDLWLIKPNCLPKLFSPSDSLTAALKRSVLLKKKKNLKLKCHNLGLAFLPSVWFQGCSYKARSLKNCIKGDVGWSDGIYCFHRNVDTSCKQHLSWANAWAQ